MADRSHGSRAHRKQQGHGGSQTYASSNTGHSHASSTYRAYDPYASSSHQANPVSGSTQYNYTADYASSDVYTSRDEQRYHQVPRNWNSQISERERERERVLNHPALAYTSNQSSNQNHHYGSHAAQPYHLLPGQPVPSPDRSRQLTPGNLHGHDQQTQQSSAMIRWAQQSQQEEPWNGVGSVRKRSEYDPYHTKL